MQEVSGVKVTPVSHRSVAVWVNVHVIFYRVVKRFVLIIIPKGNRQICLSLLYMYMKQYENHILYRTRIERKHYLSLSNDISWPHLKHIINTYVFICLIMYPAMATITTTTTATATMRPIATADNPSTWLVCLFVASSSVLLKVLVVPEVIPFTVDVVGRVEVVDKAADVTIPFMEVVPGCFVVDTDS